MFLGLAPLFLLRWRINLLTLGDEEARTMGVNAKRLRAAVILSATLITAAAVAVSGVIGWVGLVIPHLTRRMVGNNYRHLIPASSLFGSVFLLMVDNLSRNLFATEIPIGILTSFIKLVADPSNKLPQITYWLMGSLNGTSPKDVWFALVPMALGMFPLFLLRWRINLLTLGDEEARTMGVNARRLRTAVILSATLITAAAVAVSGVIGWVGLVIPHLTRRIVGNNYRHLIPASALFGSVFLLMVDNLSRNMFATEIPIGILTSFIGVPFFLYLITREGERL
jgi:ABC-type Fe3+-siderophore transport system permease subunit